MDKVIEELLQKTRRFSQEAHAILAIHEAAPSRVVVLENSYEQLAKLSLKQDELIKQALRCAENELFRAALVMAWAGFMDFLEEKMASDGLKKLSAVRPAWPTKSIEELREGVSEYQIIEATSVIGLCRKNEVKALHGLLNKRNECAHPSDFHPDLNVTLGFISEILNLIETLRKKTI